MDLANRVVGHRAAYRLLQAPFADQKVAPLLAHNDIGTANRVLDVGCGPGTNTHLFPSSEYLGVDLDESYVTDARRRHGRDFIVADVTTNFAEGQSFDFILANSLLHHIATDGVRRVLAHLAEILSSGGYIHVLDLVLPSHRGIDRTLARLDRGDYPRPIEVWHELFSERFDTVILEPYAVGIGRLTLWNMVYFKGASRRR